MLIVEKIKEIDALLAELKALQESAQNEHFKAYETKFNTLAQTLKSSITQSRDTLYKELSTNLSAQNKTLEAELAKNQKTQLEQAKNTLDTDIKNTLKSHFAKEISALKTKLETSIAQDAKKELKDEISEQITTDKTFKKDILARFDFKEELKTLDLSAQIPLDKLKVDLKALSAHILSANSFDTLSKELKKELENAIVAHLINFIEKQEALSESIKHIQAQQAKSIFKEALAQNDLIKERYEFALYLQSMKFLSTEKLLSDIAQEIFERLHKPKPKPKPPIQGKKHNILVVK